MLIEEVGPSDTVTPARGAILVDGTGKDLIAGLWDMHVHGTTNAWTYPGVGIIAGTDTMNPFIFAGFSLHDELALLVQAGLPPAQALKAATSSAARFMGLLDRRGTIELGKIADLVLLLEQAESFAQSAPRLPARRFR